MKKIETELKAPPLFKKIHLDCKNCYTRFRQRVPAQQVAGEFECDVCGAVTSWQEIDELGTPTEK